jgi:hypothetical protein
MLPVGIRLMPGRCREGSLVGLEGETVEGEGEAAAVEMAAAVEAVEVVGVEGHLEEDRCLGQLAFRWGVWGVFGITQLFCLVVYQ